MPQVLLVEGGVVRCIVAFVASYFRGKDLVLPVGGEGGIILVCQRKLAKAKIGAREEMLQLSIEEDVSAGIISDLLLIFQWTVILDVKHFALTD